MEDASVAPAAISPPATSESEVARVLAVQADYYAVLRLAPPAGNSGKRSTRAGGGGAPTLTPAAVRAAARAVALHVHPDRAASRGVDPSAATAAAAVVNTAAATLADPGRRRLYDAWAAGGLGGPRPAGETFAQWEAGGLAANLPPWLRRLLANRCGAACVGVTGLVLLAPVLVMLLALTLLCLPVRGLLWCCGVGRGAGEEEGGDEDPPGDVELGGAGASAPDVIILGDAK